MPIRNVTLTDELDSFVAAKIESGQYENASEVASAALRTLEREEQQFEAKLAELRTAIDEGNASGVAKANSLARVQRKLQRSKKKRQPVAKLRREPPVVDDGYFHFFAALILRDSPSHLFYP